MTRTQIDAFQAQGKSVWIGLANTHYQSGTFLGWVEGCLAIEDGGRISYARPEDVVLLTVTGGARPGP